MATSFATTIKPYFTECYLQHMNFMFDLSSLDDVQTNWQAINDSVVAKHAAGRLPGESLVRRSATAVL